MSENDLSYDEIKNLKPRRQGISLGMENDNFIVALDENRAYTLTAGAYYVWMQCSGEKTVEEIVKGLSKELSADPETAMSEDELKPPITIILNELAKVGLVKLD